MMRHCSPAEIWDWLQKEATLNELCINYPQEWETVQRELSAIQAHGDVQTLQKFVDRSLTQALLAINSVRKSPGNRKAWKRRCRVWFETAWLQ